MKKAIILFFLLSATVTFSQKGFDSIASITIEADFFSTDRQGNVYVVKESELFKYNKTGVLLYKYSNKGLGSISSIDVSNLLKIQLFYKDYLQVVYLDNTLSENGSPIALDDIDLQQTQLVCAAQNTDMWIYNLHNMELLLINKNLETIQQTGNLNVLLHMQINPIQLIAYNNKVYLNSSNNGILLFDVYGTYFKTIGMPNIKQFQPLGDWVYWVVSNELQAYNVISSETKNMVMPLKEFKSFRVESDLLFLQTDSAIIIYK